VHTKAANLTFIIEKPAAVEPRTSASTGTETQPALAPV
jgi:hypothetical protein